MGAERNQLVVNSHIRTMIFVNLVAEMLCEWLRLSSTEMNMHDSRASVLVPKKHIALLGSILKSTIIHSCPPSQRMLVNWKGLHKLMLE